MSTKHARTKIASDNRKLVTELIKRGVGISRTIVIDYSNLTADDIDPSPIMGETSVELQDLKTDECAMLYHRIDRPQTDSDETPDPTIAIHNFASRIHCGGGYVRGARAQEEDLCRVIPMLYASMSKTSFPHGETTCWITPNVQIMRGSDNYSLLQKSQEVPVVVVSAAAPALSHNREKWDEDRVRNTLINIFVSVKKNCPKTTTLILGAFGCGAYGNDPVQMATLMNEVIQEYGGLYRRIVVSIPRGRDGNLDAFAGNIDFFD
jgi:Microbial-type PARG, catalytic domain